MTNWKTSLAAFVIGAIYYLKTTGAQIPQSKADLWNLAIGIAFSGFGLVAKDADVTGGTRSTTAVRNF